MTTRERLKRLESYSACDNYREKDEDFKEIEKALEVLDILKKHYDRDSLTISLNDFVAFHVWKDDKGFKKVKEWLEDEKTNKEN